MRKLLIAVVAGAALIGTSTAHALTFDFSFTNTATDGVTGTVTGEIDGLVDNANNQVPTAVYIDSYPSSLGNLGTLPLNVLQSPPLVNVIDTFNVSSGNITAEDFTVEFATGEWLGFSINTGRACLTTSFPNSTGTTGSPCLNFSQNDEGGLGVMDQSFAAEDITATPLPAAFPLFATGLGALGLLGWRRKRKAQAATA